MPLLTTAIITFTTAYLRVYFLEVRVVLVDLEVDLRGRDRKRPVNRNSGRDENSGSADVDRT